jgi:hypothetical protein
MDWTSTGLRAGGFEGFVSFAELPMANVPHTPGVYVVLRDADDEPVFLEASPAGWFKNRDPTVARANLERKWLAATPVVYIGTATGGTNGRRTLSRRLDEYRRHGAGEPIAHWGGRYLWHLMDSDQLLVCWKAISAQQAEETEADLIDDFIGQFGTLPFANLKRGRQARRTVND